MPSPRLGAAPSTDRDSRSGSSAGGWRSDSSAPLPTRTATTVGAYRRTAPASSCACQDHWHPRAYFVERRQERPVGGGLRNPHHFSSIAQPFYGHRSPSVPRSELWTPPFRPFTYASAADLGCDSKRLRRARSAAAAADAVDAGRLCAPAWCSKQSSRLSVGIAEAMPLARVLAADRKTRGATVILGILSGRGTQKRLCRAPRALPEENLQRSWTSPATQDSDRRYLAP